MYKSKLDVAVLVIFFARDKQLEKVFNEIKKARPSRLYLYQDGARPGNEKDIVGINKCRSIVSDEQIDWECEVRRFYQVENKGCDPSEFIAQKWMFETEDMGIVIEDDDVPSQSFFTFCKELLERYKDDPRINMICGMNNTGVTKSAKESYFFTKKGSICGWASWRRVLDTWDGKYTWLDDENKLKKIRSQLSQEDFNHFIKSASKHKETGREFYESINAAAMFLNERVNIVTKYNMISNIGVDAGATHSVSDIKLLPKRTQRIFNMKTYEIDFPLVHPDKIIFNSEYERKMKTNKFQKFFMRVEYAMRVWKYKGFKELIKLIKAKNK